MVNVGMIGTMERTMRPGVIARRAILRAMRQAGRGAWLSAPQLATNIGGDPDATRYHLRTLLSIGMIEADDGRPRRYRLTDAGRVATD